MNASPPALTNVDAASAGRTACAGASAPIARFTPRAIDAALARLSQTVCDARLRAYARAAIGAALLEPTPIADPRAADGGFRDPGVIALSLSIQDGRAHPAFVALDLDAHPALALAAWPDRATTRDAATALPPGATEIALRTAVAGVLLDPLAAAFAQIGASAVRVVSLTRRRFADCLADAGLDVPAVRLSLTSGGGERIDCAVACDDALLDALDARMAQPAVAALAAWPALTLPGSVIVGTRAFAVDTLASLEPGDVLLRCLFPPFAAAHLSLESAQPVNVFAVWGARGHVRMHAAAMLDGTLLTLTQEGFMSDGLNSTQAADGLATDRHDQPIEVGRLELPVQFEIDTVALPLTQLSSLAPGYVVELPVQITDVQLRLVVHGQTVGFGELVAVGEHLGVRILKMAHRYGSA